MEELSAFQHLWQQSITGTGNQYSNTGSPSQEELELVTLLSFQETPKVRLLLHFYRVHDIAPDLSWVTSVVYSNTLVQQICVALSRSLRSGGQSLEFSPPHRFPCHAVVEILNRFFIFVVISYL